MSSKFLLPEVVLKEVSNALPESARSSTIIVGSLAAAWYFRDDRPWGVQTKDIDALFSPHAKAITAAREVTEMLFDAKWTMRQAPDKRFSEPGTEEVADQDLPLVRLLPPGASEDPDQWFLELMSAPDQYRPGADPKATRRVVTKYGHFGLCSFGFLGLAEWNPVATEFGVLVARPEMMALANLLHHPGISETLIHGTEDKRSNKDLGRVIALAFLANARGVRLNNDELRTWPESMAAALRAEFGTEAPALATRAGAGIEALMRSQGDVNQSLAITNRSLLAGLDVDEAAFRAAARRLNAWVLEPLAAAFK